MISVVTAVAAAHDRFLPRAYQSLVRQTVPWEWIIQQDGPGRQLGTLPPDDRIGVSANGSRLGASTTRNRALLRSAGVAVCPLDADDELAPEALARLQHAMDSTEGAAFALGETLDVFPDDVRVRRFVRQPYEHGRLPVGRLEEEWRRTSNLHLQPGAVLYRRDVVMAVGGWPAVSGMEDQDLLLSVSTEHVGAYVPDVVYLYHQHPEQTVRGTDFGRDRVLHRTWCHERLLARRRVAGNAHVEDAGLNVPLPTPAQVDALVREEWRREEARLRGTA